MYKIIIFLFVSCLLISCGSQSEKSAMNISSSGVTRIENGAIPSIKETQHNIVWKEVNSANYWSKIPNYTKLGISFSYPDNWNFNCCGDRGDGSIHRVDAPSEGSGVNPENLPYILIMKYTINCKSEDIGYFENGNCAKTLTENESFEYLTTFSGGIIQSNIGTGFVEVSRDWIETRNLFSPEKDRGFVFRKNGGIYLVQFYNYPYFQKGFVEDFLSHIKDDIKD